MHIADVTHFVPHESLLDREARERATTVYLADRRIDMLPAILSAQVFIHFPNWHLQNVEKEIMNLQKSFVPYENSKIDLP